MKTNNSATTGKRYYYKAITKPANRKEGLVNFIQMVINELENENPNEALLVAVDLINDVRFGTYDDALAGNTMERLHAELSSKHNAELQSCRESSYAAGREDMRREIMQRLGLGS